MKKDKLFTKVPNFVVQGTDEKDSLVKLSNNKMIPTVCSIINSVLIMRNECMFTIEMLLYRSKLDNNKANVKDIKECLQVLTDEGCIKSNVEDFSSIKFNNMIVLSENNLLVDNFFFQLYDEDYDAIMNSKYEIRIKLNMLTMFSWYASTGGNVGETELGSHCVSYYGYDTINSKVGLTSKTIKSVLDILESMKIIEVKHAETMKKGSQVKSSPNFVILAHQDEINENLKLAISQYIYYWEGKGWLSESKVNKAKNKGCKKKGFNKAKTIKEDKEIKMTDNKLKKYKSNDDKKKIEVKEDKVEEFKVIMKKEDKVICNSKIEQIQDLQKILDEVKDESVKHRVKQAINNLKKEIEYRSPF